MAVRLKFALIKLSYQQLAVSAAVMERDETLNVNYLKLMRVS